MRLIRPVACTSSTIVFPTAPTGRHPPVEADDRKVVASADLEVDGVVP